MKVALRFDNARIQPQQPVPAEAHVQLLRFGRLAGARRAQRRSQNAEHRLAAGTRLAGALERHAVDGARLLVVLQMAAALRVLFARFGNRVARRRRLVHHCAAAAAAASAASAAAAQADGRLCVDNVGRPLGAHRM